jgi:dipeptide/tripeptide permease
MNQAIGLDAFNFTLAGAREGFGPFLGVYLQHQGFDSARTGFAVSLAGLAGNLSMGLAGVAIPALAADITADTGHAGCGLGGVMMAYGAGAALSPALAGLVAQEFGFPAAFLALGAVAAIGLLAWIIGLRTQAGTIREKLLTPPAEKAA